MVTIGSGGTASVGTSNQAGTNGNNTQIFNIISLGGGGGAGVRCALPETGSWRDA